MRRLSGKVVGLAAKTWTVTGRATIVAGMVRRGKNNGLCNASFSRGRRVGAAVALLVLLTAAFPVAATNARRAHNAAAPAVEGEADAEIRIVFPNRAALDFDPRDLPVETVYRAARIHERAAASERSLPIKKEWLKVTAPNAFSIHLPERLPGAGDFRLARVSFSCPSGLCHGRLPIKEWTLRFDEATGDPSAYQGKGGEKSIPPFMRLGVDEASTFTADYRGRLVRIETTPGSHAERTARRATDSSLPGDDAEFGRAVQDASGGWHISGNAYSDYLVGACPEPAAAGSAKAIEPRKFAGLAWAVPFTEVAHGEIFDTRRAGADGSPETMRFAEWSGCVAITAKGIGDRMDEYETRQYAFDHGRLRLRSVSRYAAGTSYREYLEIDAGQRLLFLEQDTYEDDSRGETRLRWSRLLHEAYPNETPLLPKFDIAVVLREAEDVEAIIAPCFKARKAAP